MKDEKKALADDQLDAVIGGALRMPGPVRIPLPLPGPTFPVPDLPLPLPGRTTPKRRV